MPSVMPDEGDFQLVRDDLKPLANEFGEGEVFVPDGLESIIDTPLSNGLLNAIPWEYHVTTSTVRHRGTPVEQFIVIAGATLFCCFLLMYLRDRWGVWAVAVSGKPTA